jgi:hypothetical protein
VVFNNSPAPPIPERDFLLARPGTLNPAVKFPWIARIWLSFYVYSTEREKQKMVLVYFYTMKYPTAVPLVIGSSLLLFFTSCKSKKKEDPPKKYISVRSLIKAQVEHVDTALYSIVKVVTIDTLNPDTSYISREDFGKEAKEFLEIPDLSDQKIAKKYKEEPAIFDETLNRVIITYRAIQPEKELITKQELLITPGTISGDKVNTIMITYRKSDRKGSVTKDMLWQIDRSFQVVTRSQLPGKPEKVITTRVTWNEDYDQ